MTLSVGDNGEVTMDGVRYTLQPASAMQPSPNNDQCYWCAAYSNMQVCDAICPYCKLNYVFIRSGA